MPLDVKALARDIKAAYEKWSSSEQDDAVSIRRPQNIPIKSTDAANRFRESGNVSYCKKALSEAFFFYTMSVAFALDGSEELYKAYGNRSAVCFENDNYGGCLLDINRALRGHGTKAFKQKLLDRKARCLEKMARPAGMSVTDFNELIVNSIDPYEGREPTWLADMHRKLNTGRSSELNPRAPSKVKLKYDETWGTHFVATENIKPGEPLISEDDFVVASFITEIRYLHCDWCSQPSTLIPCPSCSLRMYCSEPCREKAYYSYHRTECKLSFSVPYLSLSDMIAVRLFLTGTEQGAKLNNLMRDLSVIDIFTANFDFTNKVLDSKDYLMYLKLNNGTFDQAVVESFMKNAVKVVHTLKKLNFFDCVPRDKKTDAGVFATALLLNNYSQKSTPLTYINQELPANIDKKFESIFLTYSAINSFIITPKEERAKHLDFTCLCEACSNNWPTYNFTSLLENTSADDIQRRMMDDFKAYDKALGFNPALSTIVDIVFPFTDDKELMKLKIHELLTIIADVMTHLYEVMGPTSYSNIELRRFFMFFLKKYLASREPHPSQNINLEFPRGSPYLYSLDKEELKRRYPKQAVDRYAIAILYNFLCRLSYYLDNVEYHLYL